MFDGAGAPYRNDCRETPCELQISPIFEDDQPDEGLPGTRFAEDLDPTEPVDSPWIPLTFADDAGAPPLPSTTAKFLEATSEGTRVRLEGTDLRPGRASVLVDGFFEPPTGIFTHFPGSGPPRSPGSTSPTTEPSRWRCASPMPSPRSTRDVDGVVQDPEIVACGVDSSYCTIAVRPLPDPDGASPARPALTAQPIDYPEPD